jgi:ATP-dependent DNA helicase RecQ
MTREVNMDPVMLGKGLTKLPSVLASMGYKALREEQKDPINSIMSGRDTFVIIPTGGGKTLLYAASTKALGFKTIVFSPLIALQRDQVLSLNLKGVRSGAINSNNTDAQNSMVLNEWMQGKLDLMFVAPERIETPAFKYAMDLLKPDMVVLDEAHTMSQWAATFRPAYKRVGEFVEKYNPKIVLALTATATSKIVTDVQDILGIQNGVVCCNYSPRNNLKLSSSFVQSDELYSSILKKVRSIKGSIIIYCDTVRHVEDLTVFLSDAGESVTYYHGQMSKQTDKDMNQDAFMSGRTRIIVCTGAFGMGIDKPDIRGVIHAYPPGSIEAVAQETGRASRDGEDAVCHMFYTENGMFTQSLLCDMTNPDASVAYACWNVLEEYKNANDEVWMTGAEISSASGVEHAASALNIFQNLGCVDKFTPDKKVYEITVNKKSDNDLLQKTLDALIEGGRLLRTTYANNKVYETTIEYAVQKLLKSETTIKTHLNKLCKEGCIEYKPPFRGKVTKILRAPTKEDYSVIEERRKQEQRKFKDVTAYHNTPDDKKWEFINNYFKLDSLLTDGGNNQ